MAKNAKKGGAVRRVSYRLPAWVKRILEVNAKQANRTETATLILAITGFYNSEEKQKQSH